METPQNGVNDVGIEFAENVKTSVLQHLEAPTSKSSRNGVMIAGIKEC